MRKKILDCNWLNHPSIQYLSKIFEDSGYDILFVGGCVRNSILKEPVSDFDIATAAHPEEIIKICKKNNVKFIPTGIKHGTLTIILDEKTYQITTFRTDEKSFGRHAKVKFVDSLALDASRRDLTINALYCTVHGEIIDPLNAFGDLKDGIIKFIGDPNKRILEDHLRILRFFRFYALYGDKNKYMDSNALKACKTHHEQINTLSKERITAEVKKLLSAPNPISAIGNMAKINVLNQILESYSIEPFSNYIKLEKKFKVKVNWIGRLLSLQQNNQNNKLLLTKKERQLIKKLNIAIYCNTPIHEFSYYNGSEVGLIYYLLQHCFGILNIEKSHIDDILSINEHLFPITASDLNPKYQGKEIGEKLGQLEQKWIKSKFTLSKHEMLLMQ